MTLIVILIGLCNCNYDTNALKHFLNTKYCASFLMITIKYTNPKLDWGIKIKSYLLSTNRI